MAPRPPPMCTRLKAEKRCHPVTLRTATAPSGNQSAHGSAIRSPVKAASDISPSPLTTTQKLRKVNGDSSPTANFITGQFRPQRRLIATMRIRARRGILPPDSEIATATALLPVAESRGLGPRRTVDLAGGLLRTAGRRRRLLGALGPRWRLGLGLAHPAMTCLR